eukprot:CAMPEP_0197516566 /NCGR_PEP_ID=MMETSP1318-20131121/1472_1 /TAXON_ID=552666 /ORGANISM="Partenskyella glossopodia, Strain RCC365" /LENGTH=440 /DNA_ID=CAMNT_0043065419 /DNA_START=192 /DNA_END=1514 /DNA_ORIENTATION=+
MRTAGAKNLILYAHGNGCDIGDMKMELDYFAHTLRAHVCAFELRGYGFNQGTPSESNICSDIKDVYEYFTKTNPEGKFPHQNIIFWGRSIGSGPTTWLASELGEQKIDIAGLILQSPFTSIKAAAQHIAGSMVGAFLSNRWNNQSRIQKIRAPVLIIHGKQDTLIPHSHSEALLEACKSRNKRLHLSETADHNRFDFTNDIISPVTKFIEELCSNSFDWRERVSGKCPTELYRIPEFAKKMHVKARRDKKIREIENPGNDFALGMDPNGGMWSVQPQQMDGWRIGVGWEERLCEQATTAAEILRSLLESTKKEEWKSNEIIQELKSTVTTSQEEIVRRLSSLENFNIVEELLKCNDLLLSVIGIYNKGIQDLTQPSALEDDKENGKKDSETSANSSSRASNVKTQQEEKKNTPSTPGTMPISNTEFRSSMSNVNGGPTSN